VHAACWAHVRRKFFDAVKLNPGDHMAAQMVACIDELFAVEAEPRNAGMDHATRHALRQERSRPILDLLRNKIEAAKASVLPSGALGKAVNYTLSLWRKLGRFLEYPEIELSNNVAENSMRPVVVGRKNWTTLAARGWSQSRCPPFGGRKLSPDGYPVARISCVRAPRPGKHVDSAHSLLHASRVGSIAILNGTRLGQQNRTA
jgi:hypothetical protein